MPYKIEHKSQNECLIQYIGGKPNRRKKRFDLSLFVFAVIALMIGIDFVVVVIGFFFLSFVMRKSQVVHNDFEIKLDRSKKRITIRDSNGSTPNQMTYSLSSFVGFGYYEILPPPNSGKISKAELFFKFDDQIKQPNMISNNSLIGEIKRKPEMGGGFFWRIPIRSTDHPVNLANARKIIAETNEWLGLESDLTMIDEEQNFDEPLQDKKILRDFRDME